MAIGQETNARAMQQEWVAERLTFLTGRRLAALVPRDPASVSSADARSSSPDRSVVVVPGSSPASCESNSMNEKESNLQYFTLEIKVATLNNHLEH